jgi:hypothetical protein
MILYNNAPVPAMTLYELGVPPQLDTKRHRFNVMGRTPVATPTMIAPARLLQLTMIAPARNTIVVFSKATVPPSMRGYSS